MIENLRVDGFRGLDALDVGALGRTNVVVGPGGCGKTSLLEAIFLFCESGNAGGLVTALEQRGMSLANKSAEETAELLSWFVSKNLPRPLATISGSVDGSERRTTLERKPPARIYAPDGGSGSARVQDFPTLLAQATAQFELVTLIGAAPWAGSLYVTPQGLLSQPAPGAPPHLPARLHGVQAHRAASQGLASLWTQVEDRGEQERVEELLRLLNPELQNVRVAAGQHSGAYVRVLDRQLGHIPLELLGDGFAKALSLACNLVAAADGVFVLDEFDVSLHVGALRQVVSFALEASRRLNVQLFVSTHSLDAVDALIDLASTEDNLHVLRLGRAGVPDRLHNFQHDEARALREELGLDLRRAV